MKKRLIALLTVLVLAVVGLIPAALAEDDKPYDSAGYYYVYNENGKGLNVRSTHGGNVGGALNYGTRIYCYYRDGGNGWALIDYSYNMPGVGFGSYACFISSRYLRKNKPPARPSGASSQTGAKTTGKTTAKTDTEDINAEFRSAKKVTPFSITVRPSRSSGWVNLRWAPSKSAEVLATYRANDKLLVIQELDNWYQAEDQDTGDVGFISKQFVAK